MAPLRARDALGVCILSVPGRGAARLETHWPLIVIVCAAIALRTAILLSSQAHVDGDEGVVGIMARHILTSGARPIFYYGQPYGGGAAIEAYLAAFSFSLFGASVVSFKLVAFALTLAALPLTWFLCLRHFDRAVAITAVVILASASAWIEWNTKVRGGYAALLPLGAAIWWLWAEIAYAEKRRTGMVFALGLLSGIAYYNQELLLPLLLLLACASALWHRERWSLVASFVLLSGVVIGASPVLYYNATHDFENLRHMLGSTRPGSFWQHALALPTVYLPRLFDPQNADSMRATLPLAAAVECATYALLIAFVCVAAFRSRGVTRVGERARRPSLQALMLVFVALHLFAYLMSRGAGVSARYLLPLYPPLAILAALAIRQLAASSRLSSRVAGAAAFALLVGIGLGNSISYLGPSRVRIAVWTQEEGFENVESSGDAIPKIIELLRAAQVRYVRTSHFVQWRLAFESNEELIASSSAHLPGGSVYPEYDRLVEAAEANGEPVAYVFHASSLHWQKAGGYTQRAGRREWVDLPTWLEGQGMRRSEVDDFVVYVPQAR